MVPSRPDLSPAEGNVRPARILVVEDENLIRAAIAEYLRISGYMVVEAADVAEAVAVLASGEPVDVVMCDVEMRGTMDGLGLARWINRRHPTLPVLLTPGRGVAISTGKKPRELLSRNSIALRSWQSASNRCSYHGTGRRPAGRSPSPVKAEIVSPCGQNRTCRTDRRSPGCSAAHRHWPYRREGSADCRGCGRSAGEVPVALDEF